MRATWTLLALLGLTLATTAARAQSDAAGDADAIRRAADSFDAGGSAYRAERYAQAAAHFEAADEAVASARALRMSLRARLAAKQYARALTHAAQALVRYPDDEATTALARDAIAAHASQLHRLRISCIVVCRLAVGTRVVPGQPRRQWVVYVEPGHTVIGASFVDGSGSDKQQLDAHAGGDNHLSLAPRTDRGRADSTAAGPAPTTHAPATAARAGTTPGGQKAQASAPREHATAAGAPHVHDGDRDGDGTEGASFIASPGLFVGLAVVTAGLGGVTVWSGIDTVNNPGVDTVREVCRGQGTACPAYQQGRDNQLRTNGLIGATAGAAVLTAAFGLFVTDWGGVDPPTSEARWWGLRPRLTLSPLGGSMAIEGAF